MLRTSLLCSLFAVGLGRLSFAQHALLAPPPLEVHALDGPEAFGPQATVVDFESLPTGIALSDQLAALGVLFERERGLPPSTWRDAILRPRGPLGERALNNHVPLAGDGPRALGPRTSGPVESALSIRFVAPQNRAGFELRSVDGEHANLLVSCRSHGRTLRTTFFDVYSDFGFVGVESTRPFDEVVLEFTNPSTGSLSLDNLRFELDLADGDGDGVPDFADRCPECADMDQADADGDGLGDACDAFPRDAADDADGDGIGADVDNCPEVFNPFQVDSDHDGIGNPCDAVFGADSDGDGVPDAEDNCPDTSNPDQFDCDDDGIGDVCDPTLISPAGIRVHLSRGQSTSFPVHVCLPPGPPKADIVIGIDTTGSMGGEIRQMKENVADFASDVRQQTPNSDIRFALVTYKDYPASYSACGYSAQYGSVGDQAFRVEAPIGTPDPEILDQIDLLSAGGGGDGPEAYTRLLWEVLQTDSGIGFRPGAARVILNVCDDVPHDCAPDQFLQGSCALASTGIDPGRDEVLFTPDDLDLQEDALVELLGRRTKLFTLYSGIDSACAWRQWSEALQGTLIRAAQDGSIDPSVDVAGIVLELIADPIVDEVRFLVGGDSGLFLDVFPPIIHGPIDVSAGSEVSAQLVVRVDSDLPANVPFLEGQLRVQADGVLLGLVRIQIDVDQECGTLSFEDLPNGLAVTPSHFSALGVSITAPPGENPFNSGPALFDSAPFGPNQGGADPDLLVDKGNVLILQENWNQSVPGIFDQPDDSALGGQFQFQFDPPVELTEVTLIDVDATSPEQDVQLTLVDVTGRTRTYFVPGGWTRDIAVEGPPGYDVLDLTTTGPQAGFRSVATASQSPQFQPQFVVRLLVEPTSSFALDDLTFCRPTD